MASAATTSISCLAGLLIAFLHCPPLHMLAQTCAEPRLLMVNTGRSSCQAVPMSKRRVHAHLLLQRRCSTVHNGNELTDNIVKLCLNNIHITFAVRGVSVLHSKKEARQSYQVVEARLKMLQAVARTQALMHFHELTSPRSWLSSS